MKRKEIIEKIKNAKGIIDGHTHIGISTRNFVQSAYPYCLSFEDLVIRMKSLGIAYSVIFGFDSIYYKTTREVQKNVTVNKTIARFPYEIENINMFKEVYDIFKEYSHMAILFALFDPSRETKKQAKLLEELYNTYPFFGVNTIPVYIRSYINDLETNGKPILDFVIKHNLPITFHSSSNDVVDPWSSVYDIIKFAEKYPELRVCLAHTARFHKPTLDKAFSLKNCYVDLSAFFIHCELARINHRIVATKKDRFPANYNNPCSVIKKLVETYPDTIIWGTDTPYYYFMQKHYSATKELSELYLRCSFDQEFKILKSLPQKYILKISNENTKHYLFGD